MTFLMLYNRVQERTPKISTRWLRDQIKGLTPITGVKEQWTGVLDDTAMRGFYIEGPLGPPIPLKDSEVLIVLAVCRT